MISAEDFCAELDRRGVTLVSGVPCSHFGGPIALLSRIPGRYVPAANEGAALAVAAGATLAGRRACVLLQNSGLGNLVNPLTSLVTTYGIPVLTFVSMRGWPDPATDEPQHEIMGLISGPVLDLVGVPYETLRRDDDLGTLAEILDRIDAELAAGRPAFVLVERGAVGKADAPGTEGPGLPSAEVVDLVARLADGAPVVATTGYTARELFAAGDLANGFPMQGSMGHASSVALGIALSRPGRPVVVIDGDGAALMHLGALSMVGHEAPRNLVHVVLDNGRHDSTGGQPTTSDTTSFAEVALATGYRTAVAARSLEDVESTVRAALGAAGPHLIVVPTAPRTGDMPPRATTARPAEAIRERFGRTLSG